jgi:hypothetical protein
MSVSKNLQHTLGLDLEFERKPSTPEPELAVDRILNVYQRATEYQLSSGLQWYVGAHEIAEHMYREFPNRLQTIAHAAGLIAALSPNEAWSTNVKNAWAFLETDRCASLPRSQDDARLITAGFDPEWVLFRPGKVNFKVQAFYKNIAEPETPGPVTIDRHAKGVLYDDPKIAKLKPHATRAQYDYYQLMYTKAATEVGILPHQLQAVTWQAWRGENKPNMNNDTSQLQLFQ